jgi:hypothetical protein
MPWLWLLRKELRRFPTSVSGATKQNSGVAAACNVLETGCNHDPGSIMGALQASAGT